MTGTTTSDRGSKYLKRREHSLMNGLYEILNMVHPNFNISTSANNGVSFLLIVILNKSCRLLFRSKRSPRCLGKKPENYGKN